MMFKHILLLIGLSVVAIFFQDQLMHVLKFFMYVHNQIANGLGAIFSMDAVGEVVQSVLALLLIPAAVGVIIAIAHFFIKQQHFPHTMSVIWVCWAVLLASVLSQTGRVTNHIAYATSIHMQPTEQNMQQNSEAHLQQNSQVVSNEKHESRW